MGSLIEELRRREAAARAEADRLRSRIEELAEDLARAEEQVSRLAIAREEVTRVLGEPAAAGLPAGEAREPAEEPRPASPIGAVAVPPWQEGADASVLPQAYQDLLEVAADAGRPLRAAEFAAAAGLSTDRAKVESLRSKLKLLAGRGREVLRQLLQDHFDLRQVREEQKARECRVPVTGTDGITRTRLETGHGRALATLFGTVRVTRCAWRKPGTASFCPADAALPRPAGRHSHSLAKLAAIEAARGSFEAAHDAVARRCGPVIGKRQLEEAVVHAAADIPDFYAARIPELCTPGTLLIMSADCKGIVMPPGALRAATAKAAARLGKMRTRLSSGEKPNRKRMAALVTVYDAEPARRRPYDVIAPPGGRHGTRALRPGPKARGEWLRYDQAMEAGWPIATGIIEGACRHIIADRLSVSGARWGLDGAEAVLTLRAVISNGDFEEYWRFHLKCEHQRLYPGIKQGQYTLGA